MNASVSPGRTLTWWPVGLAATAAACLVALLQATPRKVVRAQGHPQVAVTIQRNGRTQTWDGQAQVRPGDRLGIQVAAAGLPHVSIYGGARPTLLYRGAVSPSAAAEVPAAWTVGPTDGEAEVLWVELSQYETYGTPYYEVDDPHRWVHRVVLPLRGED